uniref:Uncharacterized protein n=1 Tax=Magallana gigas TaxID=29159 RepID=K1RL14_MAGGI
MATGINLKKFDGSENIHLWIPVLENWQEFHNVSDAEALLAISIKKGVISKEPKTFQELRHAVDQAKQELETGP